MYENHTHNVAAIAEQIKTFHATKVPFKIYHGSTNSTRILSFKRSEMIDVSNLDNILSIDVERRIAIVEPNVPMDKLVEATLDHGLIPPVIPEFPGITVGGAVQGGAGESSSFKWGFFSQTANWIEYVLADGSIIKSSPTQYADLFYGAAGSSGTLGVIITVEIQLLPVKKYVQLTYHPVRSHIDAVKSMQSSSKKSYDFIDGIMFGKDQGVIITGRLSDTKTGKAQRFNRARDPWYYIHAQKVSETRSVLNEMVPLKDYLFRYNRGAFWVGKYAFDRFGIPFNPVTRFILNPILNTRKL